MGAGTERWLRPDVQLEPLYHGWYAWIHLVPPLTAALNLAQRYLPMMASYVSSPRLHVAALRKAGFQGGPFIDLGGERVAEVEALLVQTRERGARALELAAAYQALLGLLRERARGQELQSLYAEIPAPLRGYVELCYDLAHNPCIRVFERLLYRSPYYDEHAQSVALSLVGDESARPFLMSTPRLADPDTLRLELPFRSPALDALFRARTGGVRVEALAEELGVLPAQRPLFEGLFGEPAGPRVAERYAGEGMRVRYFGHATLLIETREFNLLADPIVSYGGTSDPPRFTYADLPERIDYVLITHTHHDHILIETLLQLRHRIGTILVPRNLEGLPLDPSQQLLLEALGFSDVREVRELDELPLPGGSLTALPFLGEHHDLLVGSRTCWAVRAAGGSILLAADSCCFAPEVYEHCRELTGPVDALFLGMECEGAPISWIHAPFYPERIPRDIDRSRRARGCNAAEALRLADCFEARRVFVYAMGQEPWLRHILGNPLGPDSVPKRAIAQLVADCRAQGREAEELFARAEIPLAEV